MMRTDLIREQLQPVEIKILFQACLTFAMNRCSNEKEGLIPDEAIEEVRRALEFAVAAKPPVAPINRQ